MIASCRALALVVGIATLSAAPSTAHAQRAPWAEGVTDEQKAQAKVLLDEGNAILLGDRNFEAALAKYTAAVNVWDHPAIRFNMVRCLIQLGRNLEAAENLEKALQYGAAPLEDTVYNEAISYQKLLATQIGDIRLSCTQPGVQVTLDGQPLATCPATLTRRVLAGAHQLVGKGPGLTPRTVELVVAGGTTETVELALDPLGKNARIVHRWPSYVPWSVFGAGVGAAGLGVLAWALGNSDMREYDRWVDMRCSGNCQPSELDDVQHLQDSAKLKNAVGVSLMITGGVAVATGAVMLYLNRGRTVYPEVTVTGDGAAVSWTGRF